VDDPGRIDDRVTQPAARAVEATGMNARILPVLVLMSACSVSSFRSVAGTGRGAAPPSSSASSRAAEESPAAAEPGGWQSEPETPAHWETYDGQRVLEAPGPSIANGGGTCDAAHNHCLHSNTWFVAGAARQGKNDAMPCFRHEGKFWTWKHGDERDEGVAYRTAPATLANLSVGAVVFVYNEMDLTDLTPPRDPHRARDWENWRMVHVASIDPGTSTFRTSSGQLAIPLAITRVAVETVAISK